MLKRKITSYLEKWKDSPYKECPLIRGARQIGKSYIVEKFMQDNFESYLTIDFSRDRSLRSLFDGDLDIDRIMDDICIHFPGFKPIPGKTAILLDEIQYCSAARTSLKFFVLDGRYRVIATGSSLGMILREENDPSPPEDDLEPVGYEKEYAMYPLDFEEFLWNMGMEDAAVDSIRRRIHDRVRFGDGICDRLTRLFKIYTVVGGMPEAVQTYVDTSDMDAVRNVQKKIVEGYRNDIARYVDEKERDRILSLFDSIPSQLCEENTKFMYSRIESISIPTYDTYSKGINWLCEARIAAMCKNLSQPALPLERNAMNKSFKLYMNDSGLLAGMMDPSISKAVLKDDHRVNRGAIMENRVFSCIQSCGYTPYFFSNNHLEIDFIVNISNNVSAMEIKSGNNKRARSLHSIKENHGVKRRMKFELSDIFVDEDGVEHYPLFACAFADALKGNSDMDVTFDAGELNDMLKNGS